MQHLKEEQVSMRHCTDHWLSRLGHRTYLNIELGYAGECVCDIGEGGGGGGRVVVGEPQGGWGRRMPAGAERERPDASSSNTQCAIPADLGLGGFGEGDLSSWESSASTLQYVLCQ